MKLMQIFLFAFSLSSWAQPVITRHPTNLFVSLGANPTFRVTATTTAPPLSYQWRLNDVALTGRTNNSLIVTNTQLAHAGDYAVVVTDTSGSLTSRVTRLDVDPTFTKITTGPVVTSGGFSFSASWGDYDDDGFIDLFVSNDLGSGISNGNDFLYHNNRDGTFTRITNGPLVNDGVWSISGAWGDYDNDGKLDLFVSKPDRPNTLYRNEGDAVFARYTNGPIAIVSQYSHASVWGDANNDGWLDVFLANFGPNDPSKENVLFRSDGAGGFERLGFGAKLKGEDDSWNAMWADLDGDGFLDLFVPQGGVDNLNESDFYRNDGTGGLRLVPDSVFSLERTFGVGCAAGDFDNDGDLDVFVTNFYGQKNGLYRNDGNGKFTRLVDSVAATAAGCSVGCAWGDYDNDGWQDLFVGNLGPVRQSDFVHLREENNFLYHNNRDGTFTRIITGSLVNDLGYSTGCAWGDYDNDGFLDLVVANGWGTASQNEFLYRNNGNTNSWINFRLIGTVSNRSAIGAKVRVKATLNGQTFWQMRELSGGSNYGSQNDLRAHFGLGGAMKAELVRIEWPSGAVTELRDLATKQFLTIVEPPRLAAISRTDGTAKFALRGGIGFSYALDASSDFVTWLPLRTNTATGLTIELEDAGAPNLSRRFYRARLVKNH